MADENGSAQSANIWPLPKFYFRVKWGDNEMSFQEVSGLDIQSEEIKYRAGNSPQFSVIKMPGMVKYGNVTMKKGVFKGDNKFWEWLSQIKMNTIARVAVTISLLDEEGSETMIWVLQNAWPTKISSTDLKAEGNEVAIETIEIVHEGLTISSGDSKKKLGER
jgi:phage tail-like protein